MATIKPETQWGSTLKRKTELRRTGINRGRPKPKRDAAGNAQLSQARLDRQMYANNLCEVRWDVCCPMVMGETLAEQSYLTGQARMQLHHVQEVQFDGPDTFENTRWVCESCHTRIHAWRDLAIELGWLADPRYL